MPTPTIKSALTNAWKDYSKIVRLEEADGQGICTCVTCGVREVWDSGAMDAGHYLAARRLTSTMKFCRHNIHTQCKVCNTMGRVVQTQPYAVGKVVDVALEYHDWMLVKYGRPFIVGLKQLRNKSMNWTLPEAVDWRQDCKTHLDAIKAARLDVVGPWPCEMGEYTPAVKEAA